MKKYILLFTLFFGFKVFSQNIIVIDSIANDMCHYLSKINTIENDTTRINTLYEHKLYPYLYTVDQNEVETVARKVYFRLQRGCVDFRNLLDRLDPPAESPDRTFEKPQTEITKAELKEFKNLEEIQYYEVDGTLTRSTFKNGYWIDNFADGTYSKLHFEWINDIEFQLTFIESNNETRKDFSVPGDKYRYQILNKESDYFYLSVNIPGQEVYEGFKFYFDK